MISSKARVAKMLLFAGALAGSAMVSQAFATEPFSLRSDTFKDGTSMPRRVANNTPNNPNCVGENISPHLVWSGVPEGTKSFVITMVDPEGRGGAGVHHWVAYGIAPNVTSLAEGEASKETPKLVGGKSTQGLSVYAGPCTPAGSPHHYTFVVIATDFETIELPPGLTIPEVWAKLPGRTKAAAGLVGLFVKP